ncbi:transglycosylase SLT domain-containing protein [bacterium]|jgi:soluble lytic murein transglycosylase|nr:transglycosylase SLT domain-containing protein [bacterium]
MLLFLGFCSSIQAFENYPGITPSTPYLQALRHFYDGNYPLAKALLEEIDPKSNPYRNTLMGVILTKLNDPQSASKYLKSNNTPPEVGAYIHYLTFVRHLKKNEKKKAKQILRNSLSSAESPYISKKSILALANFYFKENEIATSKRHIDRLLSDPRKDEVIFTGARRLLIDIALDAQNIDQVLTEYGQLIQHFPEADSDRTLFKRIQKNFKHKLTIHDSLFGPYENLLYLKNLYRLKDYEKVEKQATYMVKKFPDFKYISQIYVILGKTYYFQYKFGRSIPTLRRALLFYPSDKDIGDVMFFLGLSYEKKRDFKSAKTSFIAFLNRAQKSTQFKKSINESYFATAYYFLNDYYRRFGPYEDYKKYLNVFETKYYNTMPFKQYEWESKWANLKLAVKNKPSETHIPYFKKCITNPIASSKIITWYEKLITERNENIFGDKIFRNAVIQYPQSFYTNQIYNEYFSKPFQESEFEPTGIENKTNKQFKKFNTLFMIGLADMALEEIQFYLTSIDRFSKMHVFHKTKILYKLGKPELAIKSIDTGIKSKLKKYGLYPRPMIKMAYPIVYANEIKEFSKKYRVDPLLVMALIKESSQFNPLLLKKEKYGLTQLELDVCKRLNTRLGMQWKGKHTLFNPEQNIKFGSFYTSWLLETFNYYFHYAIASYNVGPKIVQKWIKGGIEQDLQVFQDQVVYPETNEFLNKVLNTYEIYSTIYNESI